jgi:molecular chaperone GrpE
MEENQGVPIRVKDKRVKSGEPGGHETPVELPKDEGQPVIGRADTIEEKAVEETHDYLDDLRRLQAEFDNYRKRMMKEASAAGTRGAARVMERLLPVLDNFERAIEHGEGGDGVRLVFTELKAALEAEGLTEIPAAGAPFDPTVHEAVESVDDPEVEQPTVKTVYRRGYKVKDSVIRPAMVVVARPVEVTEDASPEQEAGE